ncbi:MAG TPA: 50S ribosomal protein L3 [Candidatus Polarisedimenticolia bacterium]|nr:50S ribosomal protein L3 [Candidatus Polarisedimenticolia bacterium]
MSAIEGLIGRKVGMTQIFREDGAVVPVTVLRAGPCVVVGRRTREKDGYEAVQLGLVERFSKSKLTRPRRGVFDKKGLAPLKTLREFRLGPGGAKEGEDAGPSIGDRVMVDLFSSVRQVDVIGVSKGKGFAGVMKRHHFRGGAATHGSMFHRAPGSIGSSAYPSRVFKGMRMGGHMGSDRVTVKNLDVVRIDAENNLLMVRGAVPGARGTLLLIRKARAAKRKTG